MQANLFDPGFGTDPRKLARRDAPETSQLAAAEVNTNHLESLVLDAIKTFGAAGCTSDELRGRYFSEYSYSSITARYKALSDKGYIEYIGTRKGDSGRQQRVMRAI